MRVRIVFDWVIEIPDGTDDLQQALTDRLIQESERPFGEVMGSFNVADIEELQPWEQDD